MCLLYGDNISLDVCLHTDVEELNNIVLYVETDNILLLWGVHNDFTNDNDYNNAFSASTEISALLLYTPSPLPPPTTNTATLHEFDPFAVGANDLRTNNNLWILS